MLIKYLFKKWYLVLAFTVTVIAAPLVHVKTATVSGTMVDFATAGDYQSFWQTLLKFFILFLIHGGLMLLIQIIRIRIVSLCRQDLRGDMFRAMMSVNNTAFAKPDIGFHIAAFSNDITILETKYFEAMLEGIEAVLSVITSVAAIFNLNTAMAIIMVTFQSLGVVLCYLLRNYSMKKNRTYIEKLALFTQRIKDYFSSFQMIQNYCVEDRMKNRFNKMNGETESAKQDADMAIAFVDRLGNICIPLTKFIMVGYGITLMVLGKLTMGSIFTAFQLSNQFVGPLNTIMAKMNSIEAVKSIVSRIKNLSTDSAAEKKRQDISLEGPARLSLENVGMQFGEKAVLKDISFTFEPGKKYLIIGKNGAGKSTLLKLLKRSTEEFAGRISLNGHNVKDFSYGSLSRVISYINESVPLICDTVRQNILLYRDIPEEQLKAAVDAVGLKVDLDRVIRDGDRNLSSGEMRRIEIARSLINKADIIVYDEAISTLDIPTAYEIEKALLSLEGQTLLFVSHNFSAKLLSQYDCIVLMDSGRICGFGTHEQLMESNAYYRRILKIKNG